MWFPSAKDIVEIHRQVVREHDHAVAGVLNQSVLEACVHRARHGPFPGSGTLEERAALLVRGIAQDHPFVDGNKRTAVQTLYTFLRRNGWEMTASNDEVVGFALTVASGRLHLPGIVRWVRRHARQG